RIDVDQIDCDFLVCSAHKFFGPDGLGLLYGKAAQLQTLPAWRGGGGMIEQVTLEHSHYASAPHKFEAGSPALAAIAGLAATLKFLGEQDRPAWQRHEENLCKQLHAGLAQYPSIRCYSRPDNNVGIAAFSVIEQEKNQELADFLDQRDIALRSGHHCTAPLLKALGCQTVLRASIAPYTSERDIQQLLQAIADFFQQQSIVGGSGPELDPKRSETIDIARNWQQRQKLILQWGASIASKAELRQDCRRIKGCEAALWLQADLIDGHYTFRHDSDSRLVRGLAALILTWVNGSDAETIKTYDFETQLQQLGLSKHLSPSRSNGIAALITRLRSL
ncbi:MAG: aminotransferase class V-fold PLP-dependent enzyme, partial [Cellvibrionaceae bacterium]|nr:aminotransferase class V-fold PLP-dependent enzyme [Cellvibrionaceae bacterium]